MYTDAFKVFARMSPQGKAGIIRSIQEANKDSHVFMCGDGGNDVGALKQVCVYMFFILYVSYYLSFIGFYQAHLFDDCLYLYVE